MAQQDAQVVIVPRAGPRSDGAHALLATIPAVASIAQVDDAAPAGHARVGHDTAMVALDARLP